MVVWKGVHCHTGFFVPRLPTRLHILFPSFELTLCWAGLSCASQTKCMAVSLALFVPVDVWSGQRVHYTEWDKRKADPGSLWQWLNRNPLKSSRLFFLLWAKDLEQFLCWKNQHHPRSQWNLLYLLDVTPLKQTQLFWGICWLPMQVGLDFK